MKKLGVLQVSIKTEMQSMEIGNIEIHPGLQSSQSPLIASLFESTLVPNWNRVRNWKCSDSNMSYCNNLTNEKFLILFTFWNDIIFLQCD